MLKKSVEKENQVKVYQNQGNLPLLDYIDKNISHILDVGCGAGQNARMIKSRQKSEIHGITLSVNEYHHAKKSLDQCWIADLDQSLPAGIENFKYDLILCSHSLEHLKNPKNTLRQLIKLLKKDGIVLIALPNTAVWFLRFEFLFGTFTYSDSGIMDFSHLHFFTYYNVEPLLISNLKLQVLAKTVTGNVPLWIFRRYILPPRLVKKIDNWGCKIAPNLFGYQIILKLKQESEIDSR